MDSYFTSTSSINEHFAVVVETYEDFCQLAFVCHYLILLRFNDFPMAALVWTNTTDKALVLH